MIHKIQQRLFLFISAGALLTVSGLFGIQLGLRHGFLDYLNMDEESDLSAALIQTYHHEGNSWAFLKKDSSTWPERLELALPHAEIADRLIFFDAEHNPILGHEVSHSDEESLEPLRDQGQTLGYLTLQPKRHISKRLNLRFIKSQETATLVIIIPLLGLCLALSVIAARRFLRPIKTLARGIHLLSEGNYSERIPIDSQDELGQLATDINSLALVLENNEKTRQQIVADIAHDLRTPLTILQGEIKALINGIRPTTPQALDSLNSEVLHLTSLVEDLYQLSLYDTSTINYQMKPMDPLTLLGRVIDITRPQFSSQGITLDFSHPATPAASLHADHNRLRQLFSNLLDNCLKYTDANGRVEVKVEYRPDALLICFQDSPPSIPAHDLPHIFDRLYRVESSRNRALGGSGLGLAICRSIVTAHRGTIEAGPSPLGGLSITITLPFG